MYAELFHTCRIWSGRLFITPDCVLMGKSGLMTFSALVCERLPFDRSLTLSLWGANACGHLDSNRPFAGLYYAHLLFCSELRGNLMKSLGNEKIKQNTGPYK